MSAIGRVTEAEWKESRDEATGRTLTQLTGARGNSYPLYYFIPTITSDHRYLVFHSERSGWVQLYRLDLASGEIGQLTDGRTQDAGWAIWCEYRLRGIYNHLSALNVRTNEVFYFQDDELRGTHVESFANRLVAKLPPGRMPVGQNAFSPDGTQFAFIHADEKTFRAAFAEREALMNMRLKDWAGHEHFRTHSGDYVLAVADTRTGEIREVARKDFHFHHVLWAGPKTLLINHPKGSNGMWVIDTDGSHERHLRPAEAPGAHQAAICHQIITPQGIFYEANGRKDGKAELYFGYYDLKTDTFEEVLIPGMGYVHTGHDPEGRFLFIENAGATHAIHSVHFPRDPERFHLETIRTLALPSMSGQRNHAHPLLSPDRKWVYFTDKGEHGYNQVFRVNVEDLVDRREFW
ncbi:MAG: PD40 domain-containing protein [Planctomycetota bacterium]|nr:PD40 domain-containing protein [Planctomycetota bacterium]